MFKNQLNAKGSTTLLNKNTFSAPSIDKVANTHKIIVLANTSAFNDEISTREQMCTFQKWTQLPNQPGIFRIFTIISILTILVVLVVLGNALVIAAVILRRRLRSATGLLILSLAVADLMVGLVILPFSIANEVLNSYWIFGDAWCTAWLTMDIWMCTASIYNLVAISIDRYIAIIKPLNYPMLITKFRARCIVGAVWIGSFIICSPSFLLASTERNTEEKTSAMSDTNDCRCTPSNSGMAYIVFSASSSFYIPMIIVIFVYVRIYIAACAATKSVYSGMMQVTASANKNPKNILMQNPSALSRADNMLMLRVHRGSTVKTNNEQQFETFKSPNSHSRSPTNSVQNIIQEPTMRDIEDNSGCQNPSIPSITKPLSIISASEQEKQRWFQNSGYKTEQMKDRKSPVESPLSSDIAAYIPNGECNTKLDTYDSDIPEDPLIEKNEAKEQETTVYVVQEFTNRINGMSETSSSSSSSSSTESNKDEMQSNGISTAAFLHPKSAENSATKKKRSYGTNMLSRLIRRGPRKKAGCAYEKRLSLEIKAAKTVAIVTGCFIFCWLGFSILYGLSFAIHSNEIVWSIVFWLGYLNSALNPVIYTVFNREFRTCFKRLLTCNHMIFTSRSTNQTTMYNSYNSQIRNGQGKAGVCYSSVSAPPYGGVHSSPPPGANFIEP